MFYNIGCVTFVVQHSLSRSSGVARHGVEGVHGARSVGCRHLLEPLGSRRCRLLLFAKMAAEGPKQQTYHNGKITTCFREKDTRGTCGQFHMCDFLYCAPNDVQGIARLHIRVKRTCIATRYRCEDVSVNFCTGVPKRHM